jgi:hypothetical protein
MSQVTRRTRVRRLAESVLPGRAVGGYANLIAARLRKLAAEGSTGMLPLSGHGDGAIFFRSGQVVYAESSRTPTPTPPRRDAGLAALGLAPGDASAQAVGAQPVVEPSFDRLIGLLALAEPTIDAITDLVSSESRYAKFRQSELPPVPSSSALPMELVLAEVERRRQVLRQLAPVVTADTAIARYAPRDSPRFQVSAPQWALLVRVGDGTTPRTLAMALGRSVFGTTIEVYRLLTLGLLAVPGHPPELARGPAARRPAEVMSFMRAVVDEEGSDG